jgi:hypothetical protein
VRYVYEREPGAWRPVAFGLVKKHSTSETGMRSAVTVSSIKTKFNKVGQ